MSWICDLSGGRVYSGNLNNAGERGYYWSSTAYDGNNAYNLYFRSDAVNPSNTNNRYNGFSVRCLVPFQSYAVKSFFSIIFVGEIR